MIIAAVPKVASESESAKSTGQPKGTRDLAVVAHSIGLTAAGNIRPTGWAAIALADMGNILLTTASTTTKALM